MYNASTGQFFHTGSYGGGGGADNLGNHTATQDLAMSNFSITGVNNITARKAIQANTLEIKSGSYSTYEHFQHINVGNINAGQQTITTLKIPEVNNISSSFNYLKIMHVATMPDSNHRTQVMTTHAAWQTDTAGDAYALHFSTTEEVKSPLNMVIIDPSRTTGSFDIHGNINLSVYHYDVDNVTHKLRYTVI